MNEWIPFFRFHAHLLSDAVHHLLQPVNVQLQTDRQQLLSESKQERLLAPQRGQQLRGSGELLGGVLDGAADTATLQSYLFLRLIGAEVSLVLLSLFLLGLGHHANCVIQLTTLV